VSERPTVASLHVQLVEERGARESHEAVCAERYLGISSAQKATNDALIDVSVSVKEIRNWLIGAVGGVVVLLISMVGFLGISYIDNASTRAPEVHIRR